jgi:hypothetical protein
MRSTWLDRSGPLAGNLDGPTGIGSALPTFAVGKLSCTHASARDSCASHLGGRL